MAFLDVFKIVFLPALIALFAYVLLTYLLLPLYRRHRARYSQYLPLVDSLSTRTSSLRSRATDALARLLLPRSLRWRREVVNAGSGGEEEELAFGEEEGESMVGFGGVGGVGRREDALGRGRPREEVDSQRRLSRDLERVFRDDSDDEEEEDSRRR